MKFLLAENLALKWLLNDKKLLSPDEFAKYKELAEKVLNDKVKDQLARSSDPAADAGPSS